MTTEYFEVTKFATLTLLSLLFSCKVSFSIAVVKIPSVLSFVLKSLLFLIVRRTRKESCSNFLCRGADKSLARSGRKQATATKDVEFHISYL